MMINLTVTRPITEVYNSHEIVIIYDNGAVDYYEHVTYGVEKRACKSLEEVKKRTGLSEEDFKLCYYDIKEEHLRQAQKQNWEIKQILIANL